jgi:hypothetical protein
MISQSVEKAQAVEMEGGAVEKTLAPLFDDINTVYRGSPAVSREKNLFAQAADVLFFLSFFPLSETARKGFLALFERRMERAYAEGRL